MRLQSGTSKPSMKESYIEGKLFNAGVIEKDQLVLPANRQAPLQTGVESLGIPSFGESEDMVDSDGGSQCGRVGEDGEIAENLDTMDVTPPGLGGDIPATVDFPT